MITFDVGTLYDKRIRLPLVLDLETIEIAVFNRFFKHFCLDNKI